jgi:hypothetical protein
MKILRVSLANYRGIDQSEVRFGSNGITIVEGPNEVGKTCLSEAIGLLFDYLDSSKTKSIIDIKPVHRDVGPQIELEAESGPYHFTYLKRFLVKPETSLKVTSPNPKNYTGREAHERAESILLETIDVDLWKALSIQQGQEIKQANLSTQTSLSAALDISAGGQPVDPHQETLFEAVHKEYLDYYTESGKETKYLQNPRKTQIDLEEEANLLLRQIQNIERDAIRAAELVNDLEGLIKQELVMQSDLAKYEKSLIEIKSLETNLEKTCLMLESAQKSEQAAKRSDEERIQLIDTVAKAREAFSKLSESVKSSSISAKESDVNMKKVQEDFHSTDGKRKEAESYVKLRRADFDYFRNKLDFEQMKERKGRVDGSRTEVLIAKELLKKNVVDEKKLDTIQEAERAIITAKAKLEMGSPSILLKGLDDFSFHIDNEAVAIKKGEDRTIPVSDQVSLTIPNSLQIDVTAGSSSADLLENVEDAQRKLDDICQDAGANNADEVRELFDARRKAQQSIDKQEEIEEENLRDLSYEELTSKVSMLEQSVPIYLVNRTKEPQLPTNLEDAKKEQQIAEEELEKAIASWEEANQVLISTRELQGNVSSQYQEVKIKLDIKTGELKQDEERLLRSREVAADDVIKSELSQYTEAVFMEKGKVRSAEVELNSKEPEQVKALVETTKGSLKTILSKRDAARQENTQVRTRLKVFGEEGLHEKLLTAQSNIDHIQRENVALIRRASAASLLYLTMKEERAKSRRAYIAPLKEKIERLGRLVFNNSFQVEMSDNLAVISRTVDGINVQFGSLSGGTQEQISLIARLACAITVSKHGGAPIILDDALGYTDPERLKLMGAVLAKAGQECQIIILTCVPDRYSHVGEATVVRLG